MRIKKVALIALAAITVCSMSIIGLTGCGGLEAPTEFSFTLNSRAYSFKTASGADTYQICIEKILNDATGKSLADGATITRTEQGQEITQPADAAATLITMPGSTESKYVWNSLINNTMSIKDNEGTGTVTGALSIYQFQSKADGVTPVLLNPNDADNPDEIPLGHYYASCYSVDKEGNRSEPAWQEFTVGGTLAAPLFDYSVENGKMTISITSSYINSAIRTEGLPYSVDFEINDGSSTNKTVSFDDWSYYTTVIGPETSFNFMFLEKTIDVATAQTYTVSGVAKGDGGEIKDSAKTTLSYDPFTMTSPVPTDWFSGTTTDLTATTTDGMTVTLSMSATGSKWAVTGKVGTKFFGGSYGTFTESAGTYTFNLDAASDAWATVSDFTVLAGGTVAQMTKASATVSVGSTASSGSGSATVAAAYEQRQQGGPR